MPLPSKYPSWEEDYNPISDSLNDSGCISQVRGTKGVSGLSSSPSVQSSASMSQMFPPQRGLSWSPCIEQSPMLFPGTNPWSHSSLPMSVPFCLLRLGCPYTLLFPAVSCHLAQHPGRQRLIKCCLDRQVMPSLTHGSHLPVSVPSTPFLSSCPSHPPFLPAFFSPCSLHFPWVFCMSPSP